MGLCRILPPQGVMQRPPAGAKTYNPDAAGPAGPKVRKKTYNLTNFAWLLLLLVALSTSHAEASCGGNES